MEVDNDEETAKKDLRLEDVSDLPPQRRTLSSSVP